MPLRKLNRDRNSRVALFKSLLVSLFTHESITTTYAKASAVKGLADKLISKALSGTLHDRRLVQGQIQDKAVVAKLFSEIAPRYKNPSGGYTRLTRVGNRTGDNAAMVRLSLTQKASPKVVKDAVGESSVKHKKSAQSTPVVAPKNIKPITAPKVVVKSAATRKSGDR